MSNSKIRSLLQKMLDVAENADETGYVTDVGFVDLGKLHAEVRAALAEPDLEHSLRTALGDLVDAVNVEFPGGMRDISGKTGAALIQAVNVLATPPIDVAAITEAQKHNHERPQRLD